MCKWKVTSCSEITASSVPLHRAHLICQRHICQLRCVFGWNRANTLWVSLAICCTRMQELEYTEVQCTSLCWFYLGFIVCQQFTTSYVVCVRAVASTQSFKYPYQYQHHSTSTCSQYHAAASYRLVQNLKSATKHNITYSRIYNNALQLTIDQTESDNHHTQINNLFSIFRQTV